MRISRKKLATAMIDRDVNVLQLSERSGVSRATLAAIRSGKSCAECTAQKIAEALGVELESLLERNL